MPCYSPLTGVRSTEPNPSGKYGVKILKKSQTAIQGYSESETLTLPCGQCWGCRLERSRQWAMRCIHEASLYENNCFITLTYNQDNVPEDFGLRKRDFQLFMKRLRKKYPGQKIRYFHCGEYGEKNFRPHYHACLFNHDFDDRQLFRSENGIDLDTSASLGDLWPLGFSTVGDVTFESAAYVARYIMKKVNGEKAKTHYQRVDPETGEIYQVEPEYTTMSRRSGIGAEWYEKYKRDIYPSDYLIVRGHKVQPPKYYDSLYEHIDDIKAIRIAKAKQQAWNNTPGRLQVRQKVKQAQCASLKRSLDEDYA